MGRSNVSISDFLHVVFVMPTKTPLQILYNSVVYFIVTGFCYEGVNQYPEKRLNFH